MKGKLAEIEDPLISRGTQHYSTSINQPSIPDEISGTVAESAPLIHQSLTEQERHGTVCSSIFTLISTMVGGGLLSLPFAFEQGGFIVTSFLLISVLMASTHGAFLIINSKKYCQGKIRNIEDVANVAFGRKGKFRRYIAQDITENYRDDDIVITVGRCGLALTLILSFPLLVFPCRAIINRLIWKGHKLPTKRRVGSWKSRCLHYISNDSLTGPSNAAWAFETVVFVVVSYVLAFNIPQVAMVWGFVGATGTTMMIYILPPAFYLRVRRHPEVPDGKQIAAWLLMVIGFIILILGTFQSVVNVIEPIPRHWPSHSIAANSSLVNPFNTTYFSKNN